MAREESLNTYWLWWLRGQTPVDGSGNPVPSPPGSTVPVAPIPPNRYTIASQSYTGAVSSPVADSAVVATPALQNALYEVQIQTNISGTGTFAAVDINNIKLTIGSVTDAVMIPLNSNKDFPSAICKIILRVNAQPLIMRAVANATANLIYYATITATKIAD